MASPPDPASLPPPIFVLGLRPADTALVGAIVGRNPDAFGLPELNLFVSPTLEGLWLEMPNQRHGQTHIHGLLRALAYIYGGEQTDRVCWHGSALDDAPPALADEPGVR